jgi:hypothetical protein
VEQSHVDGIVSLVDTNDFGLPGAIPIQERFALNVGHLVFTIDHALGGSWGKVWLEVRIDRDMPFDIFFLHGMRNNSFSLTPLALGATPDAAAAALVLAFGL